MCWYRRGSPPGSLRWRGFAPSAEPGEQLHATYSRCGGARRPPPRNWQRPVRSGKPETDRNHQGRPADVLGRPAPRAPVLPHIPPEGRTRDDRPDARQAARHVRLARSSTVDCNRCGRPRAVLARPQAPPPVPAQIHAESRPRRWCSERVAALGRREVRNPAVPAASGRPAPEVSRPRSRSTGARRRRTGTSPPEATPGRWRGRTTSQSRRRSGRLPRATAGPSTPATTAWRGRSTPTARPPLTAAAPRATSRAWCSRCTTGCSTGTCTTTMARQCQPTRRRSPAGHQYQTYGRYSFCEKLVPADAHRLDDFYQAMMLWPQNDGDYQSAESDFPEGHLSDTSFNAYAHYGGSGAQDPFHDAAHRHHSVACLHPGVGPRIPQLLHRRKPDRNQHEPGHVVAGALAAPGRTVGSQRRRHRACVGGVGRDLGLLAAQRDAPRHRPMMLGGVDRCEAQDEPGSPQVLEGACRETEHDLAVGLGDL